MKGSALSMALLWLGGILSSASAQVPTIHSDSLQGIEISPGIILGGTRFGATFVGFASGQLPGTFAVSVNYRPPAPGPKVLNTFVGGVWQVAVYKGGRFQGTLYGEITGGSAKWNSTGTVTESLSADLSIVGGTGMFAGAKGNGMFINATLSHLTFPPTIQGTLQLTF
jgi:hypothetical protein